MSMSITVECDMCGMEIPEGDEYHECQVRRYHLGYLRELPALKGLEKQVICWRCWERISADLEKGKVE